MTAIRARTRACNKQREAGRGSPGSGQRKTDELRPDASPASQAKVTPEGAKQTHKAIYIGKVTGDEKRDENPVTWCTAPN